MRVPTSQGPSSSRRPGAVPIALAVVATALGLGATGRAAAAQGVGGPSPPAGGETVRMPAADRPIHLNLEPLWSVGSLQGQWWEQFQALNAASFGDDGRLYLLDAPGDRVVAFDRDGEVLGPVGRPGEGPGEYRIPTNVVALEDGAVAVWDVGKKAFLLYDRDRALVDEVRPDFAAGRPDSDARRGGPGEVVALARRLVSSREGHAYFTANGVKDARGGLPLLRIPLRDGASATVVTRAAVPTWRGAGARIPIHRAYEPIPSWGPLAGGRIALQHGDGYRVDILEADGTVDLTLTRPIPARAVTDADRDAWAEDLRDRFENGEVMMAGGGGGGPRERLRRMIEETWFHPRMPVIMEITTDGGNRVWVQRRSEDDPTRPGPVDILTAEGRYIGTVAAGEAGLGLPDAFGPDGLVVWLETGPLDVPVARVYRLPAGLRSR